jgi:4-diphosphocytidyl-2C-methyl-D-erythritol kinase
MHVAFDKLKAAHKDHVAATRKDREARRQQAEPERERAIAELTSKINALASLASLLRSRAQLKRQREEQERQRQRMRGTIAGVLKLFNQQQRNDRSAEAIAAFLDMPEHFPVEVVRELLAELQG